MIIQDYNSKKELAIAAAGLFVQLANEAVSKKGYFAVALSGGSTPLETYKILAELPFRNKLPWDKTFIFWGDERCVPQNSNQNNSHIAFENLLNHVPVPRNNIYPVPTSFSPERSAEVYEEILSSFFAAHPYPLDLILLGLGENGHTASLFPHTPVLNEKKRRVKEVYVSELNMYRITFTASFINQAENVAFLVSGKSKAAVFARITGETYDPERLPAQLIKPESGQLFWLVDKEVLISAV
ncbi:MAG: 6-phosphogluconolactonase [Bacillota bacterium]